MNHLRKIVALVVFVFYMTATPAGFANGADEGRRVVETYYKVIYNHIARVQPNFPAEWVDWLTRAYIGYGYKWGVNPLLITANFFQESRHNPNAPASRTGAIGIAQLDPATADYLEVNPYDLTQNIEGGIRYLREQLETFKNTGDAATALAIAAYNAGPGAVRSYGNNIPPYPETETHLSIVARIYQDLVSEFYATEQ